MERFLGPEETRVFELADRLARSFESRAGDHYRDASFPYENYEEMRTAGFLGLTVPTELGGLGAGLYAMCVALERLAGGCSSTTLAVTMHVSPLLQLSTLWRHDPGLSGVEETLRDAATSKVVSPRCRPSPVPRR